MAKDRDGESTAHTYLTTREVAARWRKSAQAVHDMRYRGKGPPGYRLGKTVLYRLEDIEAFEATCVDEPRSA